MGDRLAPPVSLSRGWLAVVGSLFGNRWSRLGHRTPERTVPHRAVQGRRFARIQHVTCW